MGKSLRDVVFKVLSSFTSAHSTPNTHSGGSVSFRKNTPVDCHLGLLFLRSEGKDFSIHIIVHGADFLSIKHIQSFLFCRFA